LNFFNVGGRKLVADRWRRMCGRRTPSMPPADAVRHPRTIFFATPCNVPGATPDGGILAVDAATDEAAT
jgi:hypothetical protein